MNVVIDKYKALIRILIPLILLMITSIISEEIYFYCVAIIVPLYIGVAIIYRFIRANFIIDKIKWKDLIIVTIFHYIYCFMFYMYQQIQFDKFCRLNNEPLDLDSIIIFLIIIALNVLIYFSVLIIFSVLYIVFFKKRKNN